MSGVEELVLLCDNRDCTARSACYRYRARPKDAQAFVNHADATAHCNAFEPVTPGMVARGLVIDWKVADARHASAARAVDITPTRKKERA